MKEEFINSCPFCEAELKGFSTGWGCSPELWEALRKEHEEKHKSN